MTTAERLCRALRESEARERRRAATREEFDADLSPADLARGTLGETWIRDEIAKADDLGRFADIRHGSLMQPDPPNYPAIGAAVAVAVGFWVAVALIVWWVV